MQQMTMPDFGLVMLIGPSGSGKTTFGRKHFQKSEILSSDLYRTVVGDDDRSSRTTRAAFDVMGYIARKRLEARRIAVIDATNLHREHRAVFANLARQQNAPLTAIVFELSENACQRQNVKRTDDEPRPHHVIRRHWQTLKRSMKTLPKEGFRRKLRIKSPEDGADAEIRLEPLICDRRSDTRPVDIIGDVHGCRQELEDLLAKLGYRIESEAADDGGTRYRVPPGTRRAVLLGDLVDRGPDSPGTLELVMDMVEDGAAVAVQGNHHNKLMRALAGRDVQRSHGLAGTMEALERRPEAFRERVRAFLESMASHFVLDGGEPRGRPRGDGRAPAEPGGPRRACVRPLRRHRWVHRRGRPPRPRRLGQGVPRPAAVVYGHTPTARPEWVNNTLCIDTGCVWGGPLTALRYPEREIVRVPARQAYQTPAPKAMQTGAQEGPDGQQAADRELDLSELQGVLRINSRLDGTVTVKPDRSAAALEIMSRFAVDPRWLIYMPPTMAPCRAARDGDLLERPAEAFEHYLPEARRENRRLPGQTHGVPRNRGRHTRRRPRLHLHPDGPAVLRRPRARGGGPRPVPGGVRRGRAVEGPEDGLGVSRLRDHAVERQGGRADQAALHAGRHGGPDGADEGDRGAEKGRRARREPRAAAPVDGAAPGDDRAVRHRVPPVQLAGRHDRRPEDRAVPPDGHRRRRPCRQRHHCHMATIDALCRHEPILRSTEHLTVDVNDDDQVANATDCWTGRTSAGHEGMVVKPLEFVTRTEHGLIAPAVKCRGREYLRIIYGPEYTREDQMARLRKRTVGRKMALALREFALGVESLEHFVQHAPLRRVHQAAFGVLALESEPLDPRL